MSRFDEIPDQPPEAFFEIASLAAARLAGLAQGNGFKQNQLRLAQHDTQVHLLQGRILAALKPEVTERTVSSPPAAGQTRASRESVFSEIEGLAATLPQTPAVADAILDAVLTRHDRGWGLAFLKIPLAPSHIFAVVEPCGTCSGDGALLCGACQGRGEVPCNACQGQGFSPCPVCFGTGAYQKSAGSRAPCTRCNSSGRIPCQICQGLRLLRCTTCQGERKTPCPTCAHNGKLTRIFQVRWHAEASFTLVRENLAPEALRAVELIGIPNLALQKHAGIYCTTATPEGSGLILSYSAFLPLSRAEFQLAGKPLSADIAGLQARVISIEPFLDKAIKPGILSLQKVSKGSFATAALIDAACKFRVLRQILSDLGHQTKKAVYLKTVREYPLVISEKFVKAAVTYAARALLSLTKIPRLQGLAAGTGASVVFSCLWFLTTARAAVAVFLQDRDLGQHILLADVLVWVLGYVTSLFLIRILAARALKKILPDLQDESARGLPSAGEEGFWALGTTFAAWFIIAAMAPERALWMAALLKKAGLL